MFNSLRKSSPYCVKDELGWQDREVEVRSETISAICPKHLRMATHHDDHNRTRWRSEKPARRGSSMGCHRKGTVLDRRSRPSHISPRSEDQRNQIVEGA